MSRYIDADARDITATSRLVPYRYSQNLDVVEVVRCEDCKHNDTAKCPSRLHDNGFFCAQGERREDAK